MAQLFDIRGCSGSGKSHAVRSLLANYPSEKVKEVGRFTKRKERVIKYLLPGDLAVLGNYEYYQMGGLDGFRPYEEMWNLINEEAAKHSFVVYESLLVSGNTGRAKALAQGHDAHFIFLDTPVEECLRRIYARNGGKPIKEKTVHDTYSRLSKIRQRFIADGYDVTVLSPDSAPERFEQLVLESGWTPREV